MLTFLSVILILIGIGDIIWLGSRLILLAKAGELKNSLRGLDGGIWVLSIIFFIIMPITFGLAFIIIPKQSEQNWNAAYHVGEHTCIHCGSNDTEGYHVFWYNDGMLCNGSYEYNIANADYTIISCETCGHNFKYYLQTGEYKK